jgi:hypothetical protein
MRHILTGNSFYDMIWERGIPRVAPELGICPPVTMDRSVTAGLLDHGYAVHLPSRADRKVAWHYALKGWTAIRLQLQGQPRFWSHAVRPQRVLYYYPPPHARETVADG